MYGTATSISEKGKLIKFWKNMRLGSGLVFNILDEAIDDFVRNFQSMERPQY